MSPADKKHDPDKWFPLREDGAWLDPKHWEQNLCTLRDRTDGTRALDALRSVFSPNWSAGQRGTQELHPIVYHQLGVLGRHGLLDVGLMLDEMHRKKRMCQRLLNADEFHGMCGELRGGLLLRTALATVKWEPVKNGPGPDWLARWPEGSLAVEVKAPNQSQRAIEKQRVLIAFSLEFHKALSDPPIAVGSALHGTFHPNEEVVAVRTVFGAVSMSAVAGVARQAADAVRRNMPVPSVPGRFSAGAAGDFTLRPGLGDTARIDWTIHGLSEDFEYDAARISETVREAATQLRALQNTPGLVVLDGAWNMGIVNQLGSLQEILDTEPWTSGLAGVAVLRHIGTADESSEPSCVHNVVSIVPGRAHDALKRTLLPRLRACEQGHLHFDPLVPPPDRCQLSW